MHVFIRQIKIYKINILHWLNLYPNPSNVLGNSKSQLFPFTVLDIVVVLRSQYSSDTA